MQSRLGSEVMAYDLQVLNDFLKEGHEGFVEDSVQCLGGMRS